MNARYFQSSTISIIFTYYSCVQSFFDKLILQKSPSYTFFFDLQAIYDSLPYEKREQDSINTLKKVSSGMIKMHTCTFRKYTILR